MQVSDEMSLPNSDYRGNGPGQYRFARSGMSLAARRLMLFSGGLVGVLTCLIGASTLMGHRGSREVPVVVADSRPIRVKPDKPGGMQIDGAENDVFSVGANNGTSKLNPVAEAPDPNGMQATAVVPAQRAPVVAREPAQVEAPPSAIAASPPMRAAGVAAAPAVAAPAQVNAATVPGRTAAVQFAALTSEQAARSEWQQLTKRMPDLLGGRQPSFSRIDRDGHTFWRLRTAGFPDVAQAKAFCEHVKAKGGGCSVADF